MAPFGFFESPPAGMRVRLLTTLIICVTLLARIGAPFGGAAATSDGVFASDIFCKVHSMLAGPASEPSTAQRSDGDGAPTTHDHASCSFCQLGVGAARVEWVDLPPRAVNLHWRIAIAETEAPAIRFSFNRGAPARAPPFPA